MIHFPTFLNLQIATRNENLKELTKKIDPLTKNQEKSAGEMPALFFTQALEERLCAFLATFFGTFFTTFFAASVNTTGNLVELLLIHFVLVLFHNCKF